jgi:HlyD family type I secretion membrane fusion protein
MNDAALSQAAPLPAGVASDAFLFRNVREGQRLVVLGAAAIAVALATMMSWAAWAPLSGAIVAAGRVKVDSNRKTVQHRDGGTVQQILVREGEHVEAGQTLIVLDDTRIDAAFDMTRSQLDAQFIKRLRLVAERDMAPSWALPDELRRRQQEPRVREVVERELGIFATRRNALESQMKLVRRQLEESKQEAQAREREHSSLVVALTHMQEELSLNESLLAQQFVDKSRVLALRRNVAEYRIKGEANQAELAKARQYASELELRLAGLREAYATEAATQLRDTNAKVVELEEQLRAARDASERKVITAPVGGRIVDLRVSTAGGTVGPREPLLDIVPDGNPLLVEARVGVDAIGELRVGLTTDVRLTAYKQRTTPLIVGKVIYVSADALLDAQNGAPYFLMHVELDRAALKRAGDVALQPGMGAEVFVRTRDRSAFDYLLEPLIVAARRSFREY